MTNLIALIVFAALCADCVSGALPTLLGLQGQDDQVMSIVTSEMDDNYTTLWSRYKRAKFDISPGLRRYNAYWSGGEPTVMPSKYPMNCSAGFELVPLNETDRLARGYNFYHCFSTAFLQQFDLFLSLDAQIGAASGIIAYGVPEWAANPNCTGFLWGSSAFKGLLLIQIYPRLCIALCKSL